MHSASGERYHFITYRVPQFDDFISTDNSYSGRFDAAKGKIIIFEGETASSKWVSSIRARTTQGVHNFLFRLSNRFEKYILENHITFSPLQESRRLKTCTSVKCHCDLSVSWSFEWDTTNKNQYRNVTGTVFPWKQFRLCNLIIFDNEFWWYLCESAIQYFIVFFNRKTVQLTHVDIL